MNKIKNIVYITSTPFPYGSASSARTRNLTSLLSYCGFSVSVVADYKNGNDDFFETFFLDVNQPKQKEAAKKCIVLLEKMRKSKKIDAIITNALFYKVKLLVPFCKKNGIKLIIENCEWYDKSNYKHWLINPHFLRNQYMIKRLFKKADGFISISSFLNNHNASFGKPSIRIPTIIDKYSFDYDLHSLNEKVVISYCGNPGFSKELLSPVIRAISSDSSISSKIEFHIYGPTRDQVLSNKNVTKKDISHNFLFLHGTIKQQEMHEVFKRSDFIIFIRPYRRSSNAGFPTKLVESMIAGTPVIANNTGDLALYINDSDGFLIKDNTEKSVLNCLKMVLRINNDEYVKLRKSARKMAEENFDYRLYKETIIKFFTELE